MSTLVTVAQLQQDVAGVEKTLTDLEPEDHLQCLVKESRSDIPRVQVDHQVFRAFLKTGKIILVGSRSPGPPQLGLTGHTDAVELEASELPATPPQRPNSDGEGGYSSPERCLHSPTAFSDQVLQCTEPATVPLPSMKSSEPKSGWLSQVLCDPTVTDKENDRD